MANQIKVRIKNKVDPNGGLKLLEGELAVINSNGKTMLKVGDGSKEVSALGFVEMPWDEVSAWVEQHKSAISVDGSKTDVDVRHISQEDYNQLVADDAALSNTVYVVSADYVEIYGQQIKNVADPTDLSDAATKGYVDSNFQPAGNYLDTTSVAPAFSTSATYFIGEYVTHEGRLYECSETIAVSGDWDSSKWTDDDMTSPDATLDVTPNGQLRLLSANGEQLWAQGYDLATESLSSLRCDCVNLFKFEATTVSAFNDSETATYSVGERVSYGGKVYVCVTEVTTGGAWTGSTNWDEDPDTQLFEMPLPANGKVGNFIIDIDNTANTVETAATINGLNDSFSVVVQKGESVLDLLTFAPGEISELYFTQTAFRVNDLPTWKLVKNVVEDGGAE